VQLFNFRIKINITIFCITVPLLPDPDVIPELSDVENGNIVGGSGVKLSVVLKGNVPDESKNQISNDFIIFTF